MTTKTALARRGDSPPSDDGGPNYAAIERLMTSFWQDRSPHTLAAYRSDLEQFCAYLTRACGLDPKMPQLEVLRVFFGGGAGRANQLVLDYRSHMRAVDKAPKTVNRRLAAIRSVVKLARLIGMTYWSIEVEGVPEELTRDTRGPSPETVATLIEVAAKHERPELAARDVAILRITFDLGLRVGELVRLDVADLELQAAQPGCWVLGKKRTRKVLLKLPAPTVAAIRDWLTHRGKTAGPLFLSYSNFRHRDRRLVSRGAYRIIKNLGRQIGIHLHPHQLRHAAITQAVEQSVSLGLSLDQVRDFSRHKTINVLLTYRDQLSNKQSTLADAVAATLNAHDSEKQSGDPK
jgi:integrase/recombinase XerC